MVKANAGWYLKPVVTYKVFKVSCGRERGPVLFVRYWLDGSSGWWDALVLSYSYSFSDANASDVVNGTRQKPA